MAALSIVLRGGLLGVVLVGWGWTASLFGQEGQTVPPPIQLPSIGSACQPETNGAAAAHAETSPAAADDDEAHDRSAGLIDVVAFMFRLVAPDGVRFDLFFGPLDLGGDFDGAMAVSSRVAELDNALSLQCLAWMSKKDIAQLPDDCGADESRAAGLRSALKVVHEAMAAGENQLRKKWPAAELQPRMVADSLILVISFGAPPDDEGSNVTLHHARSFSADDIASMIDEIRQYCPRKADELTKEFAAQMAPRTAAPPTAAPHDAAPHDAISDAADSTDRPTLQRSSHFRLNSSPKTLPEGLTTPEEWLRAVVEAEPPHAEVWVTYEVLESEKPGNASATRQPLLAIETVKSRFVLTVDGWKQEND